MLESLLIFFILAAPILGIYSFFIYLHTLFRKFFFKNKVYDVVLSDRIELLSTSYGRVMQFLLTISVVVLLLTITIIFTNPQHFFESRHVISFAPYVALGLVTLCLLRFVYFSYISPAKKQLVLTKMMIFKREMMLPVTSSFFILVIYILANMLTASVALKPIIYLYPETTTEVTVKLEYDGELFADYPKYDDELRGWKVTAQPDSTLLNHADGREYSYLFWEGKGNKVDWDLSTGFVVPGSETREFLQEILPQIGLTPKEYNEFIVYWYPKMQDNPYNLIHFAGTQYTDTAPITTVPMFDSILRVFMVYKPLTAPIEIEPQSFPTFTREGFTVVEWGGSEI